MRQKLNKIQYPVLPLLPPFVAEWKVLYNSDVQTLWDRMNEPSKDSNNGSGINLRSSIDKAALGARETTIDILGDGATVIEFLLPQNRHFEETVLALKKDCNVSLISTASNPFEKQFSSKAINVTRVGLFRYLRAYLGCLPMSVLRAPANVSTENAIDLNIYNTDQPMILLPSLDDLNKYIFKPEKIDKTTWKKITEIYSQVNEDNNLNSNTFNSIFLSSCCLLQGQFTIMHDGSVELSYLNQVANLILNTVQTRRCHGGIRIIEKPNNAIFI